MTGPAADPTHGPRNDRAEMARTQAKIQQRAARREAAEAQKLIDEFVASARRAGLDAVPLVAQLISGGTAKTDRTGWYIKRSHTIAVGEDGGYYLLTAPGGLRARWRGVHLEPSQPGLQVGRGGRDGETGDLAEFLQRTLEGKNL
ncbi:hypothetical protein [Propionibacterium sp.]|uniref:hypothetical protein n=1 Tax=Propionibacterium sp. TaxID=1977903 RepID=UPI0039E78158